MKKLICMILVIIMLGLNGCIERIQSGGSDMDNFIIINMDSFPEDLVMVHSKNGDGRELLSVFFEGLINCDEKGNIMPGIAESWTVSADGIEYRFMLDDEAFWSDGTKITAGDFINHFSSLLNPEESNIYDYQLFSIFGAEDYRNRKAKFDKVAIRANGEKELVIRLNTACSDLLHILSQPIYGIRNNMTYLKDWRKRYKDIKFSGPFVIKEIREDGNIILEKNSFYRDRDNVSSERFMLTSKESPEAAFVDFELGFVNILQNPPLSEVKTVINSENTLITVSPDIVSLVFNLSQKSSGKDVSFRKALYEVLDPYDIIDGALPEFTLASDSFIPFSASRNVFKDNAFSGSRDKNNGKKLLENMKQIKPSTIRLIGQSSDINKKVARILAERIKKQLDINVQYKFYSEVELKIAVDEGNYDLLLGSIKVDYNSDISKLERWVSNSRDNIAKYANANYDNAFFKAKAETNKDTRKKYINQCEDILRNDLPVIYLFNDARVIVKSSYIQGLNVNPFGHIDLRKISRAKSTHRYE